MTRVNFMFTEFCYQLYRVEWLDRISTKVQLESMRQWYDNNLDEDEINYNGEMYVCYDEFMDNEFQDEEYMRTLLNDKEYATYLKIIESEDC